MPNNKSNKGGKQVTTVKNKPVRRRKNKANAMIDMPMGNIGLTQVATSQNNSKGTVSLQALSNVMRNANERKLTPAGLAFLKCAFAPPDFQATSVGGYPDTFNGMSVVKKHRVTTTFSFASGRDYYFMQSATPGIAYFTCSLAAGTPIPSTQIWDPLVYTDAVGLFGNSRNQFANNVSKFRHVSNHFELISTTNAMSWSGNIQCFKIDVEKAVASASTPDNIISLYGMTAVNAANANQYTGPFAAGVYTYSFLNDSVNQFEPITEGLSNLPNFIGVNDFCQLSGGVVLNGIPGFSNNFQSALIRVTGLTTNCTAVVKSWACVEYIPQVNSLIYEFSNLSPVDEYALKLYRAVITQLPVGVTSFQNENFWTRVWDIIKRVSQAGSLMPGQLGMASTGVNMIANSLESMFV